MKGFIIKNVMLLKWISVAVLGLSLVLFFLPYVTVFGESFNPVQMIDFYNKNQVRSDGVFEVSFGFILPVALTALSAIILVSKIKTTKSIICSILNVLSVCVYLLFFNVTFLDINSENIGFGLVGNIVIACLGIVLPIVIIVLNRKATKETISTEI